MDWFLYDRDLRHERVNHFEISQSLHSLQLTISTEMFKVVNKSFNYCRRAPLLLPLNQFYQLDKYYDNMNLQGMTDSVA